MPTFADVRLQLHCDGTNGSTSFPDESNSAQTVTAAGGAQVTTAHSKWGTGSVDVSAYAAQLNTDYTSSLGFGTGAWTIEAWIRLDDATSQERYPLSLDSGVARNTCLISSGRRMGFTGPSGYTSGSGSAQIPTFTWTHIAWAYDGTTLRAFLDGQLQWSSVRSINIGSSATLEIGRNSRDFLLDDIRVTSGAWYTSGFTPPTGPFEGEPEPDGYIADPGPLGDPAVLGEVLLVQGLIAADSPLSAPAALGALVYEGTATAASPLGSVQALALHDFTSVVAGLSTTYTMDLITPGGPVRVPISSWQATLQVGAQCYGQCVIPACLEWVSAIEEATEFAIARRVTLAGGAAVEYEMLRAPLETISLDRGPQRYTATLSGYFEAFDEDLDPPAVYDRTLTGLRSVSVSGAKRRTRCEIDWLLRPGHRAYVDGSPLVASYVNYYVTGSGDEYMDVGER